MKSLYLTKYVIKIQHGARAASVKKAWAKAEIDKKWAESSWAKRLAAKKLRTQLTDFDRFKLMRAKQTVIIFFFSILTIKEHSIFFTNLIHLFNFILTEKSFG